MGIVLKQALELTDKVNSENLLLQQLASYEAVVWSPQVDNEGVQALSDLLVAAKEETDA
jgi:hypothetical protein